MSETVIEDGSTDAAGQKPQSSILVSVFRSSVNTVVIDCSGILLILIVCHVHLFFIQIYFLSGPIFFLLQNKRKDGRSQNHPWDPGHRHAR